MNNVAVDGKLRKEEEEPVLPVTFLLPALAFDETSRYLVSVILLCLSKIDKASHCRHWRQEANEFMIHPDYIKILKLDKLALKSKSRDEFLRLAEARLPYAKNLGVAESFPFFVERAWELCGDGK